jgi:hypothetical protein
MNILADSPDQLVLQQRLVWIAVGFAVLTAPMAVMAWFARQNAPAISLVLLVIALMLAAGALGTFCDETVDFSRSDWQVVIRSRHPLRRTPKVIPLREIREAVPQSRGRTSSQIGYRIVRVTRPALARRGSTEVIPLALVYAKPEQTLRIVETINAWLRVRGSHTSSP